MFDDDEIAILQPTTYNLQEHKNGRQRWSQRWSAIR